MPRECGPRRRCACGDADLIIWRCMQDAAHPASPIQAFRDPYDGRVSARHGYSGLSSSLSSKQQAEVICVVTMRTWRRIRSCGALDASCTLRGIRTVMCNNAVWDTSTRNATRLDCFSCCTVAIVIESHSLTLCSSSVASDAYLHEMVL